MRILVTGGAGFIGSHVVERLLDGGHTVGILDEFNDYYNPAIKRDNISGFQGRVDLVEGDIRDRDLVNGVFEKGAWDAVIHLAARAGVRPSIQEPELYISTNINGTFNLLEACRVHGVKKFLFASSSSVYGVNEKVPFAEDDAINQTISPYAATKLAGEQLCSNWARLYDIKTVCLRFFTVYGPRQRPDLAIHKFARLIHSGKPIDQYGDGTTGRDYTFIEDIVGGIMGALAYEGPVFDIFNLGGSHPIELNGLIALIEAAVGGKAEINRLPEQPGDVPFTWADVEKAKRLLNYQPTTPIEEGIPKFAEWFLHTKAVHAPGA